MGKSTSLLPLFTAAAVLFSGASATLDPIVIKGSKFFFKSNSTQFFIKGVAYQSGVSASGGSTSNSSATYVDPLADETACARDIPYLQQLGANTIRTYAIDPTQDHSKCMQLLDAAGIYVLSDLPQPDQSIDRNTPEWTIDLFQRYTDVIDSLQSYTNVIGFFAGNEVTNSLNTTGASAYVKAAVRDSKQYIKSKGYRTIGVGYAADDDADVRANVAAYFNCGDVADQIDFWGYNIYEWCGDSSYQTSGYADRVAEFANYSVPAFFAEYGCNTQGGGAAGRKFTEVAALYGTNMTPVFSGGFVYEYFEEANDYGLVSVDSSSVSTLADFGAFSSQIHAATPTGVDSAAYSPTNTAGQACPTIDSTWEAATVLPPTPDANVCSCMVSSLSCVVKSGLQDTEIASLFGTVCGYAGSPCAGVSHNATTGVYGPYSMCNSTEQLSYALNTYYLSQKSVSSACDFGGNAQVVKAAAASSCSAVISSATATFTSGATATGAAASSSTKKSEASGMVFGASLGMGKFVIAGFTLVAVVSGAGMILL